MQLKYGNYSFDANSTLLDSRIDTLWNAGGQPYAQRRTITVRGYLSASGQALITLAENALQTALAIPFQDLKFLQDTGTNSSEILLNSGSISGVQIINGPHFSTTTGPEYCTIRSFEFTAMAEYPVANSFALLLNFNQTLIYWGGGIINAHRLAINGLPQKQLIYPASVYFCNQVGESVGYRAYPIPMAAQFPANLKQAPKIAYHTPDRRGKGYQAYKVSWEYMFESITPLVGVPIPWIN